MTIEELELYEALGLDIVDIIDYNKKLENLEALNRLLRGDEQND